jgi:hypothetical protein
VKPGDVIAFCRRDRGGFHEKDLSSNGRSVGSSEHRRRRAVLRQGQGPAASDDQGLSCCTSTRGHRQGIRLSYFVAWVYAGHYAAEADRRGLFNPAADPVGIDRHNGARPLGGRRADHLSIANHTGRRIPGAGPPRADPGSTTSSFVLAKPGTMATPLWSSAVSARHPAMRKQKQCNPCASEDICAAKAVKS